MATRFRDGAVFVYFALLDEPSLVIPVVAHRFGAQRGDAAPLPQRITAVLRMKEVRVVKDQPRAGHPGRRTRRPKLGQIAPRTPVVAESLLDRLINTSHQVFMNGPSYRLHKRPGRSADTTKEAIG